MSQDTVLQTFAGLHALTASLFCVNLNLFQASTLLSSHVSPQSHLYLATSLLDAFLPLAISFGLDRAPVFVRTSTAQRCVRFDGDV